MSKLILGTAGHIDHGKTALVRALTGIDTDRLPEEKQRGITIDLGFASLELGDYEFGVVDVPGHEGFIRNMLAGATGMDAVLLVVAADEGVMPQTREHLAILDLLDVRSGVVAITKRDLVAEEWAQLVIEDVRATLAGTALETSPIVAVSARTGEGLDELCDAIVAQATRPSARRRDDVFRMPIDRVFTVHGTGTVVTGTVWSGELRADRTLHLLPGRVTARVRGIQVHGRDVAVTVAGERAAVALSGVDKSSVERGDVLLDRAWQTSRMLTVRFRLIRDTDWVLKTRQRVRVHIGTTEVLARAVVLDAEWVQLRLEEAVVARVGDRVVLRSYSPVTTIAGGVVVEIEPKKQTQLEPGQVERMVALLSSNPAESLCARLAGCEAGLSVAALSQHTAHAPADIQVALQQAGMNVIAIGERVYSADVVENTIQNLTAAADRFHVREPLKPAIDRAELRGAVRARSELIDFALEAAVERGALVQRGSGVSRPGFAPQLTARQQAMRETVLETLRSAGLTPPTVGELGKTMGDPGQLAQLLRLLENEGLVRSVTPDLYVESAALDEAELRTRRELGGSEELSVAEFRRTLPVTRKHLIPLLEYFDRRGVTRRNGDLRSVPASSFNELRGTS